MINQKKKVIYFVIIGISIVGALLVFKFGMNTPGSVPSVNFSSSPVAGNPETPSQTESKKTNIGNLDSPEFPSAPVFPINEKFNRSVFESSVFKNLKDYQVLTVGKEELGKDNPFASEESSKDK